MLFGGLESSSCNETNWESLMVGETVKTGALGVEGDSNATNLLPEQVNY